MMMVADAKAPPSYTREVQELESGDARQEEKRTAPKARRNKAQVTRGRLDLGIC